MTRRTVHVATGEDAAGAAGHARAENAASDRASESPDFHRLVALLATSFLHLSSSEVDDGIRDALRTIAEFADVDRALIVLLQHDERWHVTHEWQRDGMTPLAGLLQAVETRAFPWSADRIQAGQAVEIPSVDDLPAEAIAERAVLQQVGVGAGLMVPIQSRGRIIGITGLGSADRAKRWSHDEVVLLQLVGEMFRNTLERKQTEDALRSTLDRYHCIVDANIVGISFGHTDGRILDCNDLVLKSLGKTREDLEAGRVRWDVTTAPEHRASDERALRELHRVGYCRPYEKDIVGADGRRRPILIGLAGLESDPDLFMSVGVDIAASKRAEAELRYRVAFERLAAQLSTRFINLPPQEIDEAIVQALGEIAQFLGVDRCSIFQFVEADMIAERTHGWMAAHAEAEVESIRRIPLRPFPWWREALLAGDVMHIPDVAALDESASPERALLLGRDIRTVLAVPLTIGGRLRGFMGFFAVGRTQKWTDDNVALLRVLAQVMVSALERKRVDEELRRLTIELEERVVQRTAQLAASNRELEAFSYSVSHDLRAPLRSIDGFSSILLEEYGGKLDANARDMLSRARDASQRMGALIDSLLELARVARAEMEWSDVDLTALAREVAATLQKTDPSRRVTFEIADDLRVRGEPGLLKVLLGNLMGNAWKFTSRHPAALIEVKSRMDGRDPVYFVRDDGAGFDPAYTDKLFRTFQRLHGPGEFEGHGIGLATVQRIIRMHSGGIWAEGAVEKGATFYFTIGDE